MEQATFQDVCLAASFLLRYPDAGWREQLPGVVAALAEMADADIAETLAAEAEWLRMRFNREELEKLYVETFDFGKKTNLYLSFAEFGETKERGAALLSLKREYEQAGFVLTGSELPDYFPVMLEFAAMAQPEAAARLLSPRMPALEAIADELEQGDSPYYSVFRTILSVVQKLDALTKQAGGVYS